MKITLSGSAIIPTWGSRCSSRANHCELLGDGQIEKAIPLHYLNDEFWQVSIDWPGGVTAGAPIIYNYILRNADGSSVQDWGNDRAIAPLWVKQNEILIVDSWNPPGAVENTFYTEPFKNVLLSRKPHRSSHPRAVGAPRIPSRS